MCWWGHKEMRIFLCCWSEGKTIQSHWGRGGSVGVSQKVQDWITIWLTNSTPGIEPKVTETDRVLQKPARRCWCQDSMLMLGWLTIIKQQTWSKCPPVGEHTTTYAMFTQQNMYTMWMELKSISLIHWHGVWLAPLVKHVTHDLGVVSSSLSNCNLEISVQFYYRSLCNVQRRTFRIWTT